MREGRGLCRIGSTGNTVTRITAKNGKKKNPERSRRGMKLSVRVGFRCLARGRFRAALNAGPSCNPPATRCNNVRSADSRFILASSVRISIPRADSSAPNPSPRASRAKMKSINVRFIRSVSWSRKRLPRPALCVPPMPARLSKICSRRNDRLRFQCRSQQNFTGERLRRLRHQHFHHVGYIL